MGPSGKREESLLLHGDLIPSTSPLQASILTELPQKGEN
jgi:hypothetical protein